MRRVLRAGKAAAQSWKQNDKMQSISDLEAAFASAAERSNAEKWQVNAAIHYNQWASLQKEDFKPVVDAFRALADMFRCRSCSSLYRVVPERGSEESLRCACAEININLVKA
jgi:hypothetical protein